MSAFCTIPMEALCNPHEPLMYPRRRCQELSETLLELGVDCTPLHSLLGQRRRTAALGKFKSQQVIGLV